MLLQVLRDREGAVMGVLPGGRGNDFARVAGIPRDPVAACDAMAGGRSLVAVLNGDGWVTRLFRAGERPDGAWETHPMLVPENAAVRPAMTLPSLGR